MLSSFGCTGMISPSLVLRNNIRRDLLLDGSRSLEERLMGHLRNIANGCSAHVVVNVRRKPTYIRCVDISLHGQKRRLLAECSNLRTGIALRLASCASVRSEL